MMKCKCKILYIAAMICLTLSVALYALYTYIDKSPSKASYGYDISHHNSVNNWEQVTADFMFIKATEGATYVDPKYKEYRKACKNKGIPVGPYHFLSTTSTAKSQFENFRRTVGKDFELAPAIDIEKFTGRPIPRKQMQKLIYDITNMFRKEYGCDPIIYSSEGWRIKYFSDLEDYHYWNANARKHIKCDIKQYKIGPAKGFNGVVDHNKTYYLDELMK